jgi:peptide/nickel transport system permease protein
MRHLLPRRLLIALPTVLLVLAVTFAAMHLAPGDPVRIFLGPEADEVAVRATRKALGLDQPLPAQFASWLTNFVTGDWGTSLARRTPVTQVLGDALPPTLLLTGASLLGSYLVGLLVGLVQAVRRRTGLDALLTTVTAVLASVPSYVLALGLLLVFAYGAALWGWPEGLRFPAIGAAGIGAEFLDPLARTADRARHLALPALALVVVGAAGTARFARIALSDALRQPFVRAARARGLSERRVLVRHAVRTALVPVITLLGLQLPALFSGVVFIETIFAWPGMGRVTVEAVLGRDYPVVLASTAVFAVLVVAGNLLADLLNAAVDPRQRELR